MSRVSEKRDYVIDVNAMPNAIVSTSAIHHLEPAEKRELYAACCAALAPGEMFINGDEYRPESDAEFCACSANGQSI